jgi:hypothetical protein
MARKSQTAVSCGSSENGRNSAMHGGGYRNPRRSTFEVSRYSDVGSARKRRPASQ